MICDCKLYAHEMSHFTYINVCAGLLFYIDFRRGSELRLNRWQFDFFTSHEFKKIILTPHYRFKMANRYLLRKVPIRYNLFLVDGLR